MTRKEVLSQACTQCMKELYKYAVPHIEWEDFVIENRVYNNVGPRPFEFYYIPKDVMKDICDSYVYAYKLNDQEELVEIIDILKKYCEDPIVDIRDELKYKHANNLILELISIFSHLEVDEQKLAKQVQDKFFEFLDMAGKFFNWTSELNDFNTTIYLGASPSSNKENVIKNWKEYRNRDIEINEEQIKAEYYGEEFDYETEYGEDFDS